MKKTARFISLRGLASSLALSAIPFCLRSDNAMLSSFERGGTTVAFAGTLLVGIAIACAIVFSCSKGSRLVPRVGFACFALALATVFASDAAALSAYLGAALAGVLFGFSLPISVFGWCSTISSKDPGKTLLAIGAMDPLGTKGALAAIGTANKAIMFAIMPVIGLIMGSQPIIGYNYGAKQWQRVLDTVKWASVWATGLMIFFWVLVHVIPGPIIGVFGVSGDLEEFAITVLKLDTLVLPIVGFQIVGSSYFHSSGQPFKSAILEMTRQVIYLIPLYLIFPMVLPALGISPLVAIVLAVPTADLLSCVTTAFFVAVEVKKLRRLRDAKAVEPAVA